MKSIKRGVKKMLRNSVFKKFALELANQEYDGNLREVKNLL